MQTIKDNGLWIDANNNSIPVKYIDKITKRRERAVNKIATGAEKLYDQLQKFKNLAETEMAQYLQDINAGNFDLSESGITISNFASICRIEFKSQRFEDTTDQFDVGLQIIRNLLAKWAESSKNEALVASVKIAFKKGSKGGYDYKKIKEISRIDHPNTEWQRGMQLIRDSFYTSHRKNYINVQIKDGDGNWQTIPTSLARI